MKCSAPHCTLSAMGSQEHCKKHDAQIWRHGRLTPETEHDLIKLRSRSLYQDLKCVRQVALKLGYAQATVSRHVADLVIRRPRVKTERVVSVYKATGSTKRTAKVLGLSSGTVWRRLKSFGVKVGRKDGARDWKSLYATIRARITNSDWRRLILERDDRKCVLCKSSSVTVHHKTIGLAGIRDKVLRENPELDPLRSRSELRSFTDLVLKEHDHIQGETLCSDCHDTVHSTTRMRVLPPKSARRNKP